MVKLCIGYTAPKIGAVNIEYIYGYLNIIANRPFCMTVGELFFGWKNGRKNCLEEFLPFLLGVKPFKHTFHFD